MNTPLTMAEFECFRPMFTRVTTTPLLDLSKPTPEYMRQGVLGVYHSDRLDDELIAAEMQFKMMEESTPDFMSEAHMGVNSSDELDDELVAAELQFEDVDAIPDYMRQGCLGVNEDDDQLTAWELHFKYLEEQQAVETETQRLLAIENSLNC